MADCGPPIGVVTTQQAALLAETFWLLLDPGEPVSAERLAATTGGEIATVQAELEVLSQAGRMSRTGDGEVTGSLGLTLEPTSHTISVGGALRHTWCALDALGILAALHATGWIDSAEPATGRRFRIDVEAGVPRTAGNPWVVFIAERRPVGSVIADWCPLVNIFEDEQAARAWSADRGVSGECFGLAETASLGAQLWEPRIAAGRGGDRVGQAPGQGVSRAHVHRPAGR